VRRSCSAGAQLPDRAFPASGRPEVVRRLAARVVLTASLGVREGRVELPRPFGHRILSPARLPFRHSRGDQQEWYADQEPRVLT
jgi:hypothetical protein